MIAIHSPREKALCQYRILPLAARLGAAFTLAAAFTGPLAAAFLGRSSAGEEERGAPRGDRLVPIPRIPQTSAANGCRARKSPEERVATGRMEIPFWSLIDHATGRYSVHATIKSPEKFARDYRAARRGPAHRWSCCTRSHAAWARTAFTPIFSCRARLLDRSRCPEERRAAS